MSTLSSNNQLDNEITDEMLVFKTTEELEKYIRLKINEKRRAKNKVYYAQNKDEIKSKLNSKIWYCESCDRTYKYSSRNRHPCYILVKNARKEL